MTTERTAEQGWTEPPVRVALAGLAGMAMIVIGERLTLRRPAYGTLLQRGRLGRAATNGPGLVKAAWAILRASLVVAGRLRSEAAVRNTASGLVLVAVGTLLLVDTVGGSGLVRMGLFAGIGIGQLLLGYWLGDNPEAEARESLPDPVAASE